MAEAIDVLAAIRTPYWHGDSGVHLHALTSLHAQAQQLLPDAVAKARDQGLTWHEIGQLLGVSAATAAATAMNDDQLDQDHRQSTDEGTPKSRHRVALGLR